MYKYDFDGLREITDDGRDCQEPVECYSCKDIVKNEDCDEYRFSIIPTPQDIKLKKIRYKDELICTRCTESFGD